MTTDEQREALAAVDRAAAEVRRRAAVLADAELRLTEAIRAARELDIPADVLAPRAGIGRATLYRRIGETPEKP